MKFPRSRLGYPSGKWPRHIKKWPYDTLPVGAYLIFEDIYEGYKCASAAYKWAVNNNARFKRKKFRNCYAVKRVA